MQIVTTAIWTCIFRNHSSTIHVFNVHVICVFIIFVCIAKHFGLNTQQNGHLVSKICRKYPTWCLNSFFTNVEKEKRFAMLISVRTSWYRKLNDQSVHINETFTGYHCMILHQNKQHINRNCASTHSETGSLSVTITITIVIAIVIANISHLDYARVTAHSRPHSLLQNNLNIHGMYTTRAVESSHF